MAFAASMFAVTLANQSIQAATQTRALNTNPTKQAQANTVYMMFVFLGGAVGAVLGPAAFEIGGMALVAAQASALVVAGLIAWAAATRRNRQSRQQDKADHVAVEAEDRRTRQTT
ncbi:hypothetical protein [Rhodococcus sp. T7]|uniref:hypothetical protein n=1 Tax=Rhodococcus sp. T7 TaxID=627444 RepID=UPI0013570FF5|nr:hypothetical protein [Rhodococcus sp. T7]